MTLNDLLKRNRAAVLDGGMGSLLMQRIPSYKGCFELLNAENGDIVTEIHNLYISAGADIIETNSFGGSKLKLAEYSLSERCRELNRKAAECARIAAKDKALVAGSVGPAGGLIEPVGKLTFDEVYESFREQIIGLEEGGADLIAIETMNDINEARIALMAAKENCSLPVITSVTFKEDGKTHGGTEIITAFATLAQYGADAVGANCGLGPDIIYSILSDNFSTINKLGVPVAVWANAGLPIVVEGKTTYPMTPEKFGKLASKLAELGVKIIGGCCGTNPDHIKAVKDRISSIEQKPFDYKKSFHYATSRYSSLDIQSADFIKVGERLNPTARKAFAADLKINSTQFLRSEAKAQQDEGADILDINVGTPGIDEIAAMKNSVNILTTLVKTPLMIDSENGEVLASALKNYPGIALINSINARKDKYNEIIPIVKRFHSFIVGLCIDESGVHRNASKRIEIGDKLVQMLINDGIEKERIIIDPLMLAESAEPGSAVETLKVIEHFTKQGIKTSLGISNISFGLPERKHINNAFIKEGFKRGLKFGIVNTKAFEIFDNNSLEENLAKDFIYGKDINAVKYIEHFKSSATGTISSGASKSELGILERIKMLVIEGDSDSICNEIESALKEFKPDTIMDDALIAGLNVVGDLYEKGEYFLPQMISSANAMKQGFTVLKPIMKQESSQASKSVVICTVKGDIHDIGKNIVSMMLENHGFNVYDMGKDIDNELILNKAAEVKADIICLSSLLTTTMPEMKAMSELISANKLPYKLMIGGAVVTEEYAKSIGAFYSKDAVEASHVAKKLCI